MNLDKAVEFLKDISGKVGIFYHDDADGVCSATLFLIYLRGKKIEPNIFCGDIDKKSFDAFGKEKVDTAIFVDLAVDGYPEYLDPFKDKKVILIDHHPVINDLNKSGFLHINPRLENPNTYVSASHICFDILKKAGLKDFKWLMNVGEVGDNVIKGNQEERKAANMINAVKVMKGYKGLSELVTLLSKCKKLDDFIYKTKYQRLEEKLNKEIEKQVRKFEKQEVKDVNFFEVKTKYSISSPLVNILFDMHPDKTIIVYKKRKGLYKLSGRSRKTDLGSAFKKASEGLGTGGGHPVAAGAEVKDFEEFKKKLIKIIS